jgi:hypothetical protein
MSNNLSDPLCYDMVTITYFKELFGVPNLPPFYVAFGFGRWIYH